MVYISSNLNSLGRYSFAVTYCCHKLHVQYLDLIGLLQTHGSIIVDVIKSRIETRPNREKAKQICSLFWCRSTKL